VITLNMDEHRPQHRPQRHRARPRPARHRLRRDPAFAALRETHYARNAPLAIDGPIEAHRFGRDTAAFPKAQLEASPFLAAMARRHYALDFPHIGPGDTAGLGHRTHAGGVSMNGRDDALPVLAIASWPLSVERSINAAAYRTGGVRVRF
jgi:hypothetical protein